MPRKSWKPRGGPGRVAPSPELQYWKARDPNPNPAGVPECSSRAPECSRAGEVPVDVASVDIVEVDRLRLDSPVAAEDPHVQEEIVRELVGIGGEEMGLSEEELRANNQMQEDEVMHLFLSFSP
jgi:hypothetical protein